MTKHITNHSDSLPIKKLKLEDLRDFPEKSFEKQQNIYLKEGFSQKVSLYLKLLSHSTKIPSDYKSLPILQLLESCCKDFLLNDMEIVMWGMLLEKSVWTEKHRNVKIAFLYSAYASKAKLNFEEDLVVLNSFISFKYPGFAAGYQSWAFKRSEGLCVSLREFNKVFSSFSSLPLEDIIDYNYYVDDLLHLAPPAGACEKELQLEFEVETEQELDKLPELLNLGSVLNELEVPPLPSFDRWKSVDVKEADFEIIDLKAYHE